MFYGLLGPATVVINFESFSKQDEQYFTKYFTCWTKVANSKYNRNVSNGAYLHLMDVVMKNTLALGETSSTIPPKWTELLKQNEDWLRFIEDAPFKFSFEKVF